MKVFAVCSLKGPLTPEHMKTLMPKEVPHTLKLYLDGKIEQFWFREGKGPIFLMDAPSVEDAQAVVAAMPIVEAGIAAYEFWPVGPLAPLGRLLPAA